MGIKKWGFKAAAAATGNYAKLGIDKSLLETSLIFQIDRAAKATRQRISAHLADSHLTFTDFIVLSAISEAANIPLGVIADSLDIGPSNFSNMVSLLERRKLVKRKPNGPDKRLRAILVTKRGKAFLQRALSVWSDSEEELTKQLGDTSGRTFVLKALRDLEDMPGSKL